MNIANFSAANKASVDKFFGFTGQGLEGVEQLATLNLQVAKTLLAEGEERLNAALSVKSPQEFIQLQTAAFQSVPEKATAYARQVNEIITAAGATQRTAFEAFVADAQSKLLGSMTGAMKEAPGSAQAKAFVKSAVDAANNFYDGVNKATRQVVQVAEANVKKVTEVATANTRTTRALTQA